MSWRHFADWAKQRELALRLADRMGRGRGRLRWIDRLDHVVPALHTPDLSNWSNEDLAAVWIGHATVLLRIEGFTILTDPVFAPRVGLGLGMLTGGPKRLVAPGLRLSQLPKIDMVLLSHAHFDHLDRPTLDRLPKRTPVVTAHQTRDLVADLGFADITELRWGERHELPRSPLRITATSVAHWGARTFFDMHRGYNGYLIESSKHRVLYGGDTAYHEAFAELGRVDLAILGIGAYNPYVLAHATPEQALAMADQARAERILPMHHSTFRLGHEPTKEPIERLLDALGQDPSRVIIQAVGQQWAKD